MSLLKPCYGTPQQHVTLILLLVDSSIDSSMNLEDKVPSQARGNVISTEPGQQLPSQKVIVVKEEYA